MTRGEVSNLISALHELVWMVNTEDVTVCRECRVPKAHIEIGRSVHLPGCKVGSVTRQYKLEGYY